MPQTQREKSTMHIYECLGDKSAKKKKGVHVYDYLRACLWRGGEGRASR